MATQGDNRVAGTVSSSSSSLSAPPEFLIDPDAEMINASEDGSSTLTTLPTAFRDPEEESDFSTLTTLPTAFRDPEVESDISTLTTLPTAFRDPEEESDISTLTTLPAAFRDPEEDSDSSTLTPPPTVLIHPDEDADMTDAVQQHSRLNNEYHKIGKIGKGGQGVVYLFQHKVTRRLVVAKIVRQVHSVGGWPEEALLLSYEPMRDHPRILTLVDCHPHQPSPKECTILTVYCNGRDLNHFGREFHNRDVKVPEYFLWHVIRQMSSALDFLHHGSKHTQNYKIIHRDFKPRNILLDWEDQDVEGLPNLKLADFGLATHVSCSDEDYDYRFDYGTYEWQPPERPHASEAADVWALGATIHWLATGDTPVEHPPADHTTATGAVHHWYKNAERHVRNLRLYGYSSLLNYIVTDWLLAMDYVERASSKELVGWFDDYMVDRIEEYRVSLPEWACEPDNRFETEDLEGDELAESS